MKCVCVDEGISPRRKWGSIVNPPELGVFLQRGGDSKPNQWGAQAASWTWWKFGVMGIRPGPNYSNYHNREDDTCPKPKQSSNFRWSSKTEMSPHRSSLDQLLLVHSVIFNIISKNDTEYQPGWSQTGGQPVQLLDLLQSYRSSPRGQWSLCSSTSPIWTWLAFPQIARLAL